MNNKYKFIKHRFKIKVIRLGTDGYKDIYEITLQLRVPYRTIFGNTKYKNLNVLTIRDGLLPRIETMNELFEYLIGEFYSNRDLDRTKLIIKRMLNKTK